MAERKFNTSLAWALRDYGYQVWLPQENEPRFVCPCCGESPETHCQIHQPAHCGKWCCDSKGENPKQGAWIVPSWEAEVFKLDVAGINQAEVVVACMDGPDVDSGTAWEVGYAYAKNKPVILFRTDFRMAGESKGGHPYNIMLSQSAFAHIDAPSLRDNLRTLVKAIKEALINAAFISSPPPDIAGE